MEFGSRSRCNVMLMSENVSVSLAITFLPESKYTTTEKNSTTLTGLGWCIHFGGNSGMM
jgi:hypothetical protein